MLQADKKKLIRYALIPVALAWDAFFFLVKHLYHLCVIIDDKGEKFFERHI